VLAESSSIADVGEQCCGMFGSARVSADKRHSDERVESLQTNLWRLHYKAFNFYNATLREQGV